jgi:predicted permease
VNRLRLLAMRFRATFAKREMDRALDEELQSHFEMLVEQNIGRGMPPGEALRAARLELGGADQIKESVHDQRGLPLLESLWRDVRYGARMLRKSPGFTTVAVLTLALGIGANTAMFSVINAVLLRPLAYKDPSQLVVVRYEEMGTVAGGNFLDWQSDSRSFERMGAAEAWTANLGGGDRPEQLEAMHLTSDVLPLLGVQPMLGRVLLPEEEHTGHEHVIVVSYNLWKNRLAASSVAVGQILALDGEPYTIVGVMPPGFQFAPFWDTKAQIWAPLVLDARRDDRRGASLRVFARLNSGVTPEQARAEMNAISARLEKEYPGTNGKIAIIPLQEIVVRSVRPALLMLLAAVGFVLLIACANVAHLQLVRAAAREKEMALRSALGASGPRIFRQLLTESFILSLAGALFGLLLAYSGVRLLVALAPPEIPRLETLTLDGHVFVFLLVITACAGVVFGLAPALKASRVDLTESLKEGARSSTEGVRRSRARNLLVVSEFALAMVLLVGAGLILRSFVALLAVDPGFDPANVIGMTVSLTGSRDADPHRRPAFFRELVERVRELPGVESASAINHLPLYGDNWGIPFVIEGRPLAAPGQGPSARFLAVLPGYFHTMRISIKEGRDFTQQDVLDAPHVVIINEFMANRHWPNENPIGRRIAVPDDAAKASDWFTIIGIVKDTKQADLGDPAEEQMIFPYLQTRLYLENPKSFATYLTLVVRSTLKPGAVTAAVESTVQSMDKDVPVSDVITMEQAMALQVSEPRFYVLLLGAFAAVALSLATVGIYGVVSYSVARRTHEIGIRLALGAQGRDVLGIIVSEGARLALMGIGIGVIAAFGLTRLMASLLYGVGASDTLTYASVGGLLAVVALAACYIPARRAMRVDPIVALRYE